MFPELRAVQIEVPGDVLEMREGSGEAPAHETGVSLYPPYDQRREVSGEVTSANALTEVPRPTDWTEYSIILKLPALMCSPAFPVKRPNSWQSEICQNGP